MRGRSIGQLEMARTLFRTYPKRSILGLVLMASQAFFYNAIFFTYALVLTTFYGVADAEVGYSIFPFAVGTFWGPLLALGVGFGRCSPRPHPGRLPLVVTKQTGWHPYCNRIA